MRYHRDNVLDTLEQLASRLDFFRAIIGGAEQIELTNDDLFGLWLLSGDMVRIIRQTTRILGKLIPAT
jgi:hypothetical protein